MSVKSLVVKFETDQHSGVKSRTFNTVWAQNMSTLYLTAPRAGVEAFDILQSLASHLSMTFLHVGCFLFRYGSEYRVPNIGQKSGYIQCQCAGFQKGCRDIGGRLRGSLPNVRASSSDGRHSLGGREDTRHNL